MLGRVFLLLSRVSEDFKDNLRARLCELYELRMSNHEFAAEIVIENLSWPVHQDCIAEIHNIFAGGPVYGEGTMQAHPIVDTSYETITVYYFGNMLRCPLTIPNDSFAFGSGEISSNYGHQHNWTYDPTSAAGESSYYQPFYRGYDPVRPPYQPDILPLYRHMASSVDPALPVETLHDEHSSSSDFNTPPTARHSGDHLQYSNAWLQWDPTAQQERIFPRSVGAPSIPQPSRTLAHMQTVYWQPRNADRSTHADQPALAAPLIHTDGPLSPASPTMGTSNMEAQNEAVVHYCSWQCSTNPIDALTGKDCELTFASEEDARKHLQNVHIRQNDRGPRRCHWTDCRTVTSSAAALIRHCILHFGFVKSCDQCGKTFTRADARKRHVDEQHNDLKRRMTTATPHP